MLKTVYPLKLCFAGGINRYFQIAKTMNMRGNKIVFLMFSKFQFLLCWKNLLSGSHALLFRLSGTSQLLVR